MTTATCPHCGDSEEHVGMCPRIKAVEYSDDGSVKRVEYFDVLTPNEMRGRLGFHPLLGGDELKG